MNRAVARMVAPSAQGPADAVARDARPTPGDGVAPVLALVIAAGQWNGITRAWLGVPLLGLALDVALVATVLAVLWRWRQPGVRGRLAAIDIVVAAWFGIAIAELLNPNVPTLQVGLEGFRKSALMMLGYAVVRLSGSRDASRFIRLVALLSLPALAMGIRQAFLPLPIDQAIIDSSGVSATTFAQYGAGRSFSPMSGPFHFGLIAAVTLLVAVVAAMEHRLRWLLVVAIAGVALALSITRANIVGTLVALVVAGLVYLALRGRRGAVIVGVYACLLVVASTVLVLSTWNDPAIGRGIEDLVRIYNPAEDRNLSLRFDYWGDFLGAIAQSPLVGYGTSAAADGFAAAYAGSGSAYFNPHSIYFKVALEQGIGGLALLVMALAMILGHAVRSPRAGVGAVTAGVLVLVAVSGLAGPMLDAYPFNLAFWVLAGFAVNLSVGRNGGPVPAVARRAADARPDPRIGPLHPGSVPAGVGR